MPPRLLRAATPREIRRAFGAPALQAVNSHANAIEDLTAIVAAHDALIHPTAGALTADVQASKALHARPFLGRLRWLLLGS